MAPQVVPVKFSELSELSSIAKRNRLMLPFNSKPHWFGIYADGKVVCCRRYYERGRTAFVTSVFCHPDYRGRGFGSACVDMGILTGKLNGCRSMIATCTPDSWPMYQRRGAVITRRFKNECVQIQLNLCPETIA